MEKGALNQFQIIDLCFDLPSRKFDYTRNLSLLLLLYVYLSYTRRGGDQLQIIQSFNHHLTFSSSEFSSNIIDYIRIIATKEGKKELYINSKPSTFVLIFQVEKRWKFLLSSKYCPLYTNYIIIIFTYPIKGRKNKKSSSTKGNRTSANEETIFTRAEVMLNSLRITFS